MTGALGPRLVLVTRETEYEQLLARHATRGQATAFLRRRSQSLAGVDTQRDVQAAMLAEIRAGVPKGWRIASVRRAELDRFLFGPEDVVVAVGQDGLVANVAKYLVGQPVIGVNADPARNPGVLVPHAPREVAALLLRAASGTLATQGRTMVRAELDDGQSLLALNEVFVGHASHQSARYTIAYNGQEEAQSSSGLIVASGTGATGWALSISRATGVAVNLRPDEAAAMFLVREPWPSQATGTTIVAGRLGAEDALRVVSRMNEDGVVFADGMEQDRIPFGWGSALAVRVADQRLRLVPAEGKAATARPVVANSRSGKAGPPPMPVPVPAPLAVPVPVPVSAPVPAPAAGPVRPAPKPPVPRAALVRLIVGLGWIAFGLLLLLMTFSGLHGLTLAVDVAAAFLRGDAEVVRPDGAASVVFLGLPLAVLLHLVRRRAHGRGLPWWAVLGLGLGLTVGLDLGLNQATGWLAAANGYGACPSQATPPAPPTTYARDGRCGAPK